MVEPYSKEQNCSWCPNTAVNAVKMTLILKASELYGSGGSNQ
jgi:hypothetical protein